MRRRGHRDRPPARPKPRAAARRRRRQASEQALVLLDRKRRVVGARRKRIEQFARRFRRAAHGVAGGREIVEQRDHARRHVEADRVAGAARRAGIIRHQDGDAPFARAALPASDQRGDPIRDHRDAVRLRPAGERVKASPSCGGNGSLKATTPASTRPSSSGSTTCMARSAAPRPRGLSRQAARLVVALTTCSTGTSGASSGVGSSALPPAAKAVVVTISAGFEPRERLAQKRGGLAILQAGDEQRRRRQAARGERLAQRIDRRGVGGEQHARGRR